MNFSRAFKTIVFRSVALVTKKLWAILDFFFQRPDFSSALYPTLKIKKIYQKILLISILNPIPAWGGGQFDPPL